jgi:transposase-like protein
MTKRTPPYSSEVRARAVRMVLEHQLRSLLLILLHQNCRVGQGGSLAAGVLPSEREPPS